MTSSLFQKFKTLLSLKETGMYFFFLSPSAKISSRAGMFKSQHCITARHCNRKLLITRLWFLVQASDYFSRRKTSGGRSIPRELCSVLLLYVESCHITHTCHFPSNSIVCKRTRQLPCTLPGRGKGIQPHF